MSDLSLSMINTGALRQAKYRATEHGRLSEGKRKALSYLRKTGGTTMKSLITYGITTADFTDEELSALSPKVQTMLSELSSTKEPSKEVLVIPFDKLPMKDVDFIVDTINDEFETSSQGQVSKSTLNGYNNILLKHQQILSTQVLTRYQLFHAYKYFTKDVIAIIQAHQPTIYKTYLTPIVSLIKHSSIFERFLGEDTCKTFWDAFERGKAVSKICQAKKVATGECLQWSDIIAKCESLAKEKPFSIDHLLLSLMTLIPTLRDDFGLIRIYDKYPRMKIACKKEPESGTYLPENFYVVEDGKLYLQHYKQWRTKGKVVIPFKEDLQTIVKESLKAFPRDWLICKEDGTPYFDGHLSGLIRNLYGYSINDIRHALDTYIHTNPKITFDEIIIVDEGMLHSVTVGCDYVRYGGKTDVKDKP